MFTNNIEDAKRSIGTTMNFSYQTCINLINKYPEKRAKWIYGCREELNGKADMVLWLLDDPNNSELYDYAQEFKYKLINKLTAR